MHSLEHPENLLWVGPRIESQKMPGIRKLQSEIVKSLSFEVIFTRFLFHLCNWSLYDLWQISFQISLN